LLVRVYGIDQIHQCLCLRHVPIIQVEFFAGVAAAKRIKVNELERMTQNDHRKHQNQMRADDAKGDPLASSFEQSDNLAKPEYSKQDKQPIEKVEVTPIIV